MKLSKTQFHSNVHSFPELRFEDQRLSSFSGSVVLQASFQIGFRSVVLILIVHLMLGYRRLRDIDRYRDDPVVLRTLGLKRMPHISTISRSLARVAMDFDGSVISTGRFSEGTAVRYNKHKKGERSYYPLFCTIAQAAQVLDVFHRSGNVHDSHDSIMFMSKCIAVVRARLPGAVLESRKDSAFFSDETVK